LNGQKPREIAVRVLRTRARGGEFVENLLDKTFADTPLAPADRGLCQELVYGVVRWQSALDWLIARKTGGRPQKAALQDLLRLGLYQIFWLDRIPGHAAVHETVELAKHGGFGPQAGFVNAVLRGCLRESDALREALARLKSEQPHLGWSHPEWLVARWNARWGPEPTARLLEWNNTPPRTCARINSLRFGPAEPASQISNLKSQIPKHAGDVLAQWREENVEYDFVRRDWFEENLVFELKAHPPLARLRSLQQGWFYVQDPSTLLAVRELDPQPGETILDLCAAPGGKTTYLAQLMRNEGRIVAHDTGPERLKLIEENCARLGVACVQTALPSALDPRPPGAAKRSGDGSTFDRILIDAPCSNTGVMRRRVDLRWRIRPEEIERLRRAQLDLLRQAAPRLKLGGVLVYSTCSLEPEENGQVVNEFLSEHPEFQLERTRELLPMTDGVDGAFTARLARQG